MTIPTVPTVRTIDGRTRLVAIVGDPIAQVRSPEVFNPRLAAAGHNAVLVPVHVPAAQFDTIMPALMRIPNLAGLLRGRLHDAIGAKAAAAARIG